MHASAPIVPFPHPLPAAITTVIPDEIIARTASSMGPLVPMVLDGMTSPMDMLTTAGSAAFFATQSIPAITSASEP
jgi:hypothetical protein